MLNKTLVFTKDTYNKTIFVTRAFAAPKKQVWDAWTRPEILDQWWAPKPWKAKTKFMDFREGGYWLYCMEGSDGMQAWSRADFLKIETEAYYRGKDGFCDEAGKLNADFPMMDWQNFFEDTEGSTLVKIEIRFAESSDLEKIIEMGFETGFTSALQNLDALLES